MKCFSPLKDNLILRKLFQNGKWKIVGFEKLSYFEPTNSLFFCYIPASWNYGLAWMELIFMISIVSSKFLGVRINLLHSVPNFRHFFSKKYHSAFRPCWSPCLPAKIGNWNLVWLTRLTAIFAQFTAKTEDAAGTLCSGLPNFAQKLWGFILDPDLYMSWFASEDNFCLQWTN